MVAVWFYIPGEIGRKAVKLINVDFGIFYRTICYPNFCGWICQRIKATGKNCIPDADHIARYDQVLHNKTYQKGTGRPDTH